MESGADRLTRPLLTPVSLWAVLRERPSLLGLELLWRWVCGGLLLGVAAYDASRIWAASHPALQATGLFRLSGDSLLEDPSHLTTVLAAAFDVIRPQVERAVWGLAPLALFCWIVAFALGRGAVLARYDARLARRPWLLAGTEGLRLGVLFGASYAWSALVNGAAAVSLRGAAPNLLLYGLLVLLATGAMGWLWARTARAAELCVVLAMAQRLGFGAAFRQAWAMPRDGRDGWFAPVRRARGRARLWLAFLVVTVTFLPDPFAQGWAQGAWWVALTLLLLGAAGAVRLAVLFAMFGAFPRTFAAQKSVF